jgi:tetratricopeptide (TPR) repeat protein
MVLVLVGSVGAWWYYRTRPGVQFQQARAAVSQGDSDRAELLATYLEESDHADMADLIRGELALRTGRQAVEERDRLAPWNSVLACTQLMTAAGTSISQYQPAPFAVWLHEPPPPPTAFPPQAWIWEQARLTERAEAAFFHAFQHLRPIQDEALIADASLMMGEAIVRLREFGRPVPLAEALRRLELVLDHRPDCIEAHRYLALLLLEVQAIHPAMDHLRRVGELDPSDGRPFRTLGLILRNQQKPARAIEAYQQALAGKLERHVSAEVVEELARLLVNEGKVAEARAVLDQCPEPHRQSPAIRVIEAECLWRTMQVPECEQLLGAALREDPDLVPGLRLRAEIAMAQDHPERAIVDLERAVRLELADYALRHQLAEAYAAAGGTAQAQQQRERRDEIQRQLRRLASLEAAASANPTDAAAREAVADVWLKLEQPEKARMWLRAALACDPTNNRLRERARQPGR